MTAKEAETRKAVDRMRAFATDAPGLIGEDKELAFFYRADVLLVLDWMDARSSTPASPEGLAVPQGDPDPSPKPTGDGLVDREVIARIVDRRWWDLRDIYLARGVSEYSAAATADSSFKPDRKNALRKADEIITLLGGRSDSSARSEAALGEAIDQREATEEALSQAFFLITGRSPEWSNKFGHREALAEIDDAQIALRARIRQLEPSTGHEVVTDDAFHLLYPDDPKSTLHGAHTEGGEG